ncbi:MAG: hypothetical protein U0103_23290 [Candidatus Obscuribacterales bacterium]
MPKFKWKMQGSKPPMTVISPPPSVLLPIIVAIAVGVTMLLRGKVSEQDKESRAKHLEYQKYQDTAK